MFASYRPTLFRKDSYLWFFFIIAFLPLTDFVLPAHLHFADLLRPIFVFAILGLGLNIVTGYAGMLHLGVAGFMAIGAYTFAILTCDIYPFQFGFFSALLCSILSGALVGLILGLPTTRLMGDYLAIVTLGFGEIVQSLLRNLEGITKGTQGINPLPPPQVFGYTFQTEIYQPWYYLFLGILFCVALMSHRLENSRFGRSWIALREDELASKCMGLENARIRLLAFAIGSGMCGLAGAMWASMFGSSGEPSNYDFQISITALCIIIIGGLGSIRGVLLGALLMIGFNSILLVKLSDYLTSQGFIESGAIYTSPTNWKYLIFGSVLILMMRFRPQGFFPPRGAGGGLR